MTEPHPDPETAPEPDDEGLSPFLPSRFGLPGAVMLSWMIAGGVLAGGFLVAYGTMAERISGRALLYTAGGLYLAGAIIGGGLGGALGMFGRPLHMAAKRAFRDQLVALLYALPALFLAFVLTGWIAMTVVAVSLGEVLPLVGVAGAYLVAFMAVWIALRFGWFGMRQAWHRFSEEVDKLRNVRIRIETNDDDRGSGGGSDGNAGRDGEDRATE